MKQKQYCNCGFPQGSPVPHKHSNIEGEKQDWEKLIDDLYFTIYSNLATKEEFRKKLLALFAQREEKVKRETAEEVLKHLDEGSFCMGDSVKIMEIKKSIWGRLSLLDAKSGTDIDFSTKEERK